METRTILLTGASSGFGRLAAVQLAERGHRVFASMRDAEGSNATAADELRSEAADAKGNLEVVELDVTSDASVRDAVGAILERADRLDVVVNNAGVMHTGITEAFTAEQFHTQLDVNLVGPFRVARATLPHMRERGEGLLVQVSSIGGRLAFPFFGLYHASKWGLEALSESLRYELAASAVDCVVVEPGPHATSLVPNRPRPEDRARVASYGELADAVEELVGGFADTFADPEAPTDPTRVAEAIVEVIEASPQERPFRTVVGIDLGVAELNEAVESFRLGALSALGMEAMERAVGA